MLTYPIMPIFQPLIKKENSMEIPDDVLQVLIRSRAEGSALYLPPEQLERKLYLSVDKVLKALGGKWDRKTEAHLFTRNIEEAIDDAINFGEVTDLKKELQFYETPAGIVTQMIGLADLKDTDTVLEPSAGMGAIIRHIPLSRIRTDAVEINDLMAIHIKPDVRFVYALDFLKFSPAVNQKRYDKIIMNPPFSNQQDIKHVDHALGFLKEGGTLVSIVSEAVFFRQNNLTKMFNTKLMHFRSCENFHLEAGAFAESGTMIKTRILKVVK